MELLPPRRMLPVILSRFVSDRLKKNGDGGDCD